LQIPNQKIQFFHNQALFTANIDISVFAYDQNENLIEQNFSTKEIHVENYDQTISQFHFTVYQINMLLPVGFCKLAVQVHDKNTKFENTKYRETFITPFNQNKLMMSSIQLCQKITKIDTSFGGSAFYKNDREIIPIPNRTFGNEQNLMGLYFEVYNLSFMNSDTNNTFLAQYQIRNNQNKIITQKTYRLNKPGKDAHISLNCPVNDLPFGHYKLKVTIIDEEIKNVTSNETDFFIQSFATDEIYKNFTTNIEYLEYIASSDEIKKLKKTKSDLLNQAVKRFWQAKDPTPETPENELLETYYQRIMEANSAFGFGKTPGWRTDQGRIFILYGSPSQRYKNTISQSFGKMEIWQYKEINKQFVFVDKYGFGEYRLYRPSNLSLLKN
jgi:GWxTD domain-containing protein